MGNKGFAMHSPRSPIYGETLARCAHAVYPLDFSGRRHAGGLADQCFKVVRNAFLRNPSKTFLGTYDIHMGEIYVYMDPRCNKCEEKTWKNIQLNILPCAKMKAHGKPQGYAVCLEGSSRQRFAGQD
jgi:hypothetical protein